MVGWGGVVDTDALLSSSPSLIWLQMGFGLAGADIDVEPGEIFSSDDEDARLVIDEENTSGSGGTEERK